MASSENKENYKRAAETLSQLAYKEAGLEDYLKSIEKAYIPPEVKDKISITLTVARIAAEKKVTYRWEF